MITTDRRQDALREMTNIGVAHAATALAQLTGQTVRLQVSEVSALTLGQVPTALGGAERLVAGLYFKVLGDLRGSILMVLPRSSVATLSHILLGSDSCQADSLDDSAVSMLQEVGNIMASAYLTALSNVTGLSLMPSVPHFAYDMAGSLVDHILAELGEAADTALLLETDFGSDTQAVTGRFFLIPDADSLEALGEGLDAGAGD